MQSIHLRYLALTILYGTAHTTAHSPTQVIYTHKRTGVKNEQPMLLTHQLFNILLGGVCGPIMWPAMVYDDLTIAECKLKGKNPDKYGSMF
jgi:hypothetical protein